MKCHIQGNGRWSLRSLRWGEGIRRKRRVGRKRSIGRVRRVGRIRGVTGGGGCCQLREEKPGVDTPQDEKEKDADQQQAGQGLAVQDSEYREQGNLFGSIGWLCHWSPP